jgi:predicted negative regulator of RcsB-dependent stress response
MAEYINDQDRAQAIQQWIAKYASSVIIGVVLALCLMYGHQYWQKKQVLLKVEASSAYEQLLSISPETNPMTYQETANNIISLYPKTPYASMANFLLAKFYVNQGKYPEALASLGWISAHGHNAIFEQIAALRAARIALTLKQYDQALTDLQQIKSPSFALMADELRGDIALAQGNVEKARTFYTYALQDNQHAQMLQPLLKAKLHSLPAAVGSRSAS